MRARCPAACLVATLLLVPACGDESVEPPGGAASTGAGGGGGAGGSIAVDSSDSCGHAHNDYLHDRPLRDALDHGFCSVEADVFLVDGELLVAHTESALDPARTLVSLYLDPLRELAKSGALASTGGGIGPHGGPLQLLIDVKADAEGTYAVLDPLLASYADIFTVFQDGTATDGLVTAVISGARAQKTMEGQPVRYAAIDGRIGDPAEPVAPGTPLTLVPLVSQDWATLFFWYGAEPFAGQDKAELDGYVAEAHGGGRLVRFWNTVDTPVVWAELARAKVDLLNVDDLDGLEAFKKEHDGAVP